MSTRPFELTVRQRHNIVIDVNVDGFTTEANTDNGSCYALMLTKTIHIAVERWKKDI